MTYRRLLGTAVAAIAFVACSNAQEAREVEAPVAVDQRLPSIDHVAPPRDSVGGIPARFEWTAAAGADQYALGVWDDAGRLMWRSDRIQGTSVDLPPDVRLDFGTYFWSVTALHERRAVAESGLSAFVVDR